MRQTGRPHVGESATATARRRHPGALTGHKVLTTFHTDDTTGALLRLLDIGIDPFLIASTVSAVVSQRLVRVLCQNCRQPFVPRPEMIASFFVDLRGVEAFTFYQPKGCMHCNGTGFKGRVALHELLVVNDAIREAVMSRKTSTQIRLIARDQAHLISMREDGFYKATQGVTTLEEVVRMVFHQESDALSPRPLDEVIALCEGKELPEARPSRKTEYKAVERAPLKPPFMSSRASSPTAARRIVSIVRRQHRRTERANRGHFEASRKTAGVGRDYRRRILGDFVIPSLRKRLRTSEGGTLPSSRSRSGQYRRISSKLCCRKKPPAADRAVNGLRQVGY